MSWLHDTTRDAPGGRSMLPSSCTILPIVAVPGAPGCFTWAVDELSYLKVSIARHAAEGLTRTALPGVSVVCAPSTSEPLCAVAEPTLSVIAQGVKQTALNGRPFTYGPGPFVVVSVDLPVIGHVTRATAREPFLAFVLELRPERIAALLLETAPAGGSGAEAVDPVPAGLAVSNASPALLDVTAR